jgi:hypothetical protein
MPARPGASRSFDIWLGMSALGILAIVLSVKKKLSRFEPHSYLVRTQFGECREHLHGVLARRSECRIVEHAPNSARSGKTFQLYR